MEIETRIGARHDHQDARVARRAVASALRRFEGRPLRVRVRLTARAPNSTTFRIHVWRGYGPVVVVEKNGASAPEAIQEAADPIKRTLRRRKRAMRARRSRARSSRTRIPSRKEHA